MAVPEDRAGRSTESGNDPLLALQLSAQLNLEPVTAFHGFEESHYRAGYKFNLERRLLDEQIKDAVPAKCRFELDPIALVIVARYAESVGFVPRIVFALRRIARVCFATQFKLGCMSISRDHSGCLLPLQPRSLLHLR
jgi:hypothetical protein